MELDLPPELERYVDEQVRNGRFASRSELVAHALRSRIAEDEKDREYFRERLRLAEEDIAAGRVIPADDAFFESLRERVRAVSRKLEAERMADAGKAAAGGR